MTNVSLLDLLLFVVCKNNVIFSSSAELPIYFGSFNTSTKRTYRVVYKMSGLDLSTYCNVCVFPRCLAGVRCRQHWCT